jgi:hypothetical protein
MLATPEDIELLSEAEKRGGINNDWLKLAGCFVPFEKGGESDAGDGWMPNYYVPTQYFINWSKGAIADMRKNPGVAWKNERFFFKKGLTFSISGIYAPTFRLNSGAVFEAKGSGIFCDYFGPEELLGVLCSKLVRFLLKNYVKHSVDTSGDDIASIPFAVDFDPRIAYFVKEIVRKQQENLRYDYASNEQLEIDRLVYEAYGLNDADIREVEYWYVRRYPKLAAAQRSALAAKQSTTVEQLTEHTCLHLYCDESCHLPHDRAPFLLLGLLACPAKRVRTAHEQLSAIWERHALPKHFEVKWTKVSPAKLEFYRAVTEWFFASEDITFRALALPDKQRLYATLPEEPRDALYYRLYYQLLRGAIEQENRYRVFLDLKDTRGSEKLAHLTGILRADADDPYGKSVENLQHVHSHEVKLLQVCDLILGAISFARRPKKDVESPAKRKLVLLIEERLGYPLTGDSPPGADKFALTTWHDPDALLL